MKIGDQLVSLEPAKELKELGVKQDSLFAWYRYANTTNIVIDDRDRQECEEKLCSAYTVAELGEMPPIECSLYKSRNRELYGDKILFFCSDSNGRVLIYSEKEADARAKMLIYLIKEGIIKAEDIK